MCDITTIISLIHVIMQA